LSPEHPENFIIPDIGEIFHEIENTEGITPHQVLEQKEESQTLKTSEEETKAISKRELESVISEVMARQLAPIKKDLAELKQPRISLQDVIAGLGYIFGIAGIVMYFLQRRS